MPKIETDINAAIAEPNSHAATAMHSMLETLQRFHSIHIVNDYEGLKKLTQSPMIDLLFVHLNFYFSDPLPTLEHLQTMKEHDKPFPFTVVAFIDEETPAIKQQCDALGIHTLAYPFSPEQLEEKINTLFP